jgi:glutamate formiminotransferase/formiminotetrahydrofolate cyclodeaminase
MQAAYGSLAVIKAMAETANPNSISDAGVAALCARSAVIGAFMNVKINASGYKDKGFTDAIIAEGNKIEQQAMDLEAEIIEMVNLKIG